MDTIVNHHEQNIEIARVKHADAVAALRKLENQFDALNTAINGFHFELVDVQRMASRYDQLKSEMYFTRLLVTHLKQVLDEAKVTFANHQRQESILSTKAEQKEKCRKGPKILSRFF